MASIMSNPKQAPEMKVAKYIWSVIEKYLSRTDTNLEKLGKLIGLSHPTVCARKKKPYELKVSELIRICVKLKIPAKEISQALIDALE